jgi:outer membrane immunogenic protein
VNNMKKILIAALFGAAAATPALAQDGAPFTGPRVEALVGYDNVKGDGGHRDGVTYGAGIGYDFQLGGAVLGVEGEATDSSAKGCEAGFITATDSICANAKRDLYAGARVGVAVAPSTLLYAKAGYTNARYGFLGTDGTVEDQQHIDVDGWRVGAGVEQKLGTNLYAKAEYRYSNYEQGLARHQVVAGLGFRF